MLQLGFVLEDLASSQIAYTLILNSNKYLQENNDVNINLFYDRNALPCIFPKFSRFHISSAASFFGHLISTSLKTFNSIRSVPKAKKYYYINDLEYLRKGCDIPQLEELYKNDQIVKFTRCKDYYDELTKKGYKIHPKVVEDFDIKTILEIIQEK